MGNVNIRELVVESMLEMEKEGIFLSAMESAVLEKYDYYDSRDKAFYKRLLDGTCENKIRIDYILGLFSATKINKMKPYIRAVLRMSIYQIIWMDSVPDSAACNEAVKLVTKRGFAGLKGFVNGVLRNISRNKENIRYPDKKENLTKYLSVMYSCPEWIVNKFIEENGVEAAEKILQAFEKDRSISVRLRVSGEDCEKMVQAWGKAEVSVTPNPYLDYARFLNNTGSVAELEGFKEGHFIVQDTGSMLVAHLAGIKPGDTVMDVCAAPGGKSIHAADILKDGCVLSYDISEERCERIMENIQRLGIKNISVKCHDATKFIPDMEEKADVVIVDAPCSGLGVIGHKSDIKYRVQPEDIESLSKLQRQIIDTAVRYVKPGGRLVYSTCTISKTENTEQADYIQTKYDFKPVSIGVKDLEAADGRLQLLPGREVSDGFFISVFEK